MPHAEERLSVTIGRPADGAAGEPSVGVTPERLHELARLSPDELVVWLLDRFSAEVAAVQREFGELRSDRQVMSVAELTDEDFDLIMAADMPEEFDELNVELSMEPKRPC